MISVLARTWGDMWHVANHAPYLGSEWECMHMSPRHHQPPPRDICGVCIPTPQIWGLNGGAQGRYAVLAPLRPSGSEWGCNLHISCRSPQCPSPHVRGYVARCIPRPKTGVRMGGQARVPSPPPAAPKGNCPGLYYKVTYVFITNSNINNIIIIISKNYKKTTTPHQ